MASIVETITIEPMRRTDLEAVMQIDERCFSAPWTASAYVVELSNRSASYLVARRGQKIVGYGGVWVIMDEAHLTTLAVDPVERRRRVGERLLLGLLEEGVLRGASRATLEVRESNGGAQDLYRKYGFYEAALRRTYYTDNGENAVVMWADGLNTPAFRTLLTERRGAIALDRLP